MVNGKKQAFLLLKFFIKKRKQGEGKERIGEFINKSVKNVENSAKHIRKPYKKECSENIHKMDVKYTIL